MNTENTIAKILKVYAILNFAACFFIGCFLCDGLGALVFAIWLAVSICINFVIYACGELLQLLHDIKLNTARSAVGVPVVPAPIVPDELPEL